MSASSVSSYSFGAELGPQDHRKLEARWIDRRLAIAAQIRRVSSQEGREIVGRKHGDMSGIIIPYFWPGDSGAREYRLRRDNPDMEVGSVPGSFKEKNKYISPPGRGNLLYLPPNVKKEELGDTKINVILTEGELKALALDRAAFMEEGNRKFLPVAVSGVWNWRGIIGKTKGSDGSRRDVHGVIPDIERFAWSGRKVFIAFDADIISKPAVKVARSCLSRELRQRGAHVLYIEWPESQGKGVDDFLASQGPDAFFELLDNSITSDGASGWHARLATSKEGKPVGSLANVMAALRYAPEWDGVLGYNEFSTETVACAPTPWGRQPGHVWKDVDDIYAAEWLQKNGIPASVKTCTEAIQAVASESPFHPVKTYLNGLVWDGEPRVDCWPMHYAGVAPSNYSSAVGRRWLISAVARIFEPGCKADCCLILQGDQGVGKSTLLSILGGDWYTDEVAEFGTKDANVGLLGVWIIELPELDNFNRAETSRVKAVMSRASDHYRPVFGRRAANFPRQCVFAGSVNDEEFLKDATGGRRFWPVRCKGQINLELLRRDRDQLWAEATEMYREGKSWWLDRESLIAEANIEQKDRYEADVWLPVLETWLVGRSDASTEEFLQRGLEKAPGTWNALDKKRVAGCFQHLGWEKYRAPAEPGESQRPRRYRPKNLSHLDYLD